MKKSATLLFILNSMTALFALPSQSDGLDIDQVLSNQRLYRKYFECFTNIGQCTPDGQELKEALPEAITSDCQRCSLKQKIGAEKMLKFMIEKKPDDYSILEKMYDPEGYFRKKHAERHGSMFKHR